MLSLRRWSGRSGPERYDLSTRAFLYLMLAAVPLFALSLARGQHQVRAAGLAVFELLAVAQPTACVALLHTGLRSYLARGAGPGRWLVALASGLTAVGLLAAGAAFPAFTRPPANAIALSAWVVMIFCGTLTAALSPLLRLPVLIGAVLAGAVATFGLAAGAGADPAGSALVDGFFYGVYAGIAVLSYRVSAWTLRIMWELDGARVMHARLSVAEERLRFARDLHDVLGRNLSLMAVKSELAAQLVRRGEHRAAEQMLEVRQVAHESLREMRAVVSGYRATDLDEECAGARAVLRSAGVSCRVIGDAAGLPADVQAALGWVVREGTTNIIRHSDATGCTIEFQLLDEPGTARVRLSMDNDRAHALNASAGGTGLLGLGERLACLGGSITSSRPGSDHFRLEAMLPVTAAAPPSGPGGSGPGAAAPGPGRPVPAASTDRRAP